LTGGVVVLAGLVDAPGEVVDAVPAGFGFATGVVPAAGAIALAGLFVAAPDASGLFVAPAGAAAVSGLFTLVAGVMG
jgi:hypothetical protein